MAIYNPLEQMRWLIFFVLSSKKYFGSVRNDAPSPPVDACNSLRCCALFFYSAAEGINGRVLPLETSFPFVYSSVAGTETKTQNIN
jgi:hypothetical protein